MATINETISKGNKYRRLKDATSKIWQRISFWTAASDVEFENGSTLEESMGDINGITDDLTSNSSDVAASAAAVYALNSKITSFSGSLSDLYNAFVAKGVTPSSKTLSACVDAVDELYNSGFNAGYDSGDSYDSNELFFTGWSDASAYYVSFIVPKHYTTIKATGSDIHFYNAEKKHITLNKGLTYDISDLVGTSLTVWTASYTGSSFVSLVKS